MINVKHEGRYDPELNIAFFKFINQPKTFEDVDYIISESVKYYLKGGKNKVWVITDITGMGLPPKNIVQDYYNKIKPLTDKHVIDYCVICSTPIEKILTQIFNILMGSKHPVFKTREEAIEWTLKEQEKIGRFIPLDPW